MKTSNVEKFKIIELIKDLIFAIDKYLVNFPNKEMELKRRIKDSGYELLLLTYEANVTTNVEKKKDLQERGIAIIKFLDFLLNLCYEKQIINAKRYFKFGESLDNIVKYFAGWVNSTKLEMSKEPKK